MGPVAFACFAVTILVLAVLSGTRMTHAILLTGGLPFMLFSPDLRVSGLHPQAVMLFVMVLAVLVSFVSRPSSALKEGIGFPVIPAFSLYALLSLSWSGDLMHGIRMITKLLAPFLFLLSGMVWLRREPELRTAERMVFSCALAVLAIAVANTLFDGFMAPDRYWIQRNILTAPWMSPANFSFLTGSAALLALGSYFESRRYAYLLLYGLFGASVFWAFTRISMAGLVAGTGLIVCLMSRSFLAKAVIPVALCAAFVASFFLVDSMRNRMFRSRDVDFSMLVRSSPEKVESVLMTSGRSALWREAARRFVGASPAAGGGAGSVDAWLESRSTLSRLHSEYLRLLCDLGVVGLLLYLSAIVHLGRRLWEVRRGSRDGGTRKYAAVAMAGLLYFAITMLTDNTFNYATEFGLYVFSFAAFAFASEGIQRGLEGMCREEAE